MRGLANRSEGFGGPGPVDKSEGFGWAGRAQGPSIKVRDLGGRAGPGPVDKSTVWAAWSRDLYLVLYCSYSSYKVINYINSYKCIRNYIGKCITILITSVKPLRVDRLFAILPATSSAED